MVFSPVCLPTSILKLPLFKVIVDCCAPSAPAIAVILLDPAVTDEIATFYFGG